jgi:hypothetical protein
MPVYADIHSDPLYLFVFTPPYSGSTALAGVLNSAPWSMVLNPNGEGQWLLPGLINKALRWEADMEVNWDSVRAVWGQKVKQVEQLTGRVDLVIEKSPPNMVRADGLLKAYPDNAVLVFNRNPFANCASILYRNHKADELTDERRLHLLTVLARDWIRYAEHLKRIIDTRAPVVLSYEEFCRDTEKALEKVISRVPQLQGADPGWQVRVKDYEPQRISDHNARQIGRLSESEKARLSEVLSEQQELVADFGYDVDWRVPLAQGGAS